MTPCPSVKRKNGKSNPQPPLASKLNVSACRKSMLFAVFPLVLSLCPTASSLPIEPTAKELLQEMQRRPVFFVPARVGWNTTHKQTTKLSLPLERYGPQATTRAVRA